jgi:molecular chaperone DnaJ
VKETVTVPKGVNTGINLRLNGKGHYTSTGPSGDLMISITVKPHTYFRRDNFDILTDCYISVCDAILGKEMKIKTLNGTAKIKIDAGTQHNQKKKLLNLGIQKLPPNQNLKGNHIVTFKIEIPKNLTSEQKEALLNYQKVEKPIQLN